MYVSVGWMGWSVVDVSKTVYAMCVSVGWMGWSVVDVSMGCMFQLDGWVGV